MSYNPKIITDPNKVKATRLIVSSHIEAARRSLANAVRGLVDIGERDMSDEIDRLIDGKLWEMANATRSAVVVLGGKES